VTPRIRHEWRERIAAEYTSAAITQHFVLWSMQAGAPPDLIDDGLEIVKDELVHSRMSNEVYVAAGGAEAPAIDPTSLALGRRSSDLLDDVTLAALRVFCIGETIAVPLFRHLRARSTEPVARAALDRILRDEVRHRDFGWDVLDWLFQLRGERVKTLVGAELVAMSAMLESQYGAGNPVVASGGTIDDEERAWGLAPPGEYAAILAGAIETEYVGRFAARGIDWHLCTKSDRRQLET
jgi:hypothetical protein